MTVAELALETRLLLALAGAVFLWALALGVLKYRQILASPTGHAHPYVDIAHRSALMYSFALLLLAVFAELSTWPTAVDATAGLIAAFFFVAAIGSYHWHGVRRDTDNQLRHPDRLVRTFMVALIVGEIGGSAVLVAGFLQAWLRS
ncbi:hypothetical protein [Nocardioides daejeonensis]|uniref:hypothetical protein n=1 Tax=Nocardioides daejeonensis TaxID=1046556 RepID=UPI000D7469F7|nr:hypothetical protein [Nocardioides daejeonensis]